MQSLSNTILLLLIVSYAVCNELVLVQVLYRHGVRSPIRFYPTDQHKNNWPMGAGQLTNIGKIGEYRLGQFLRKRYIDGKFMSSNYSNTEVHIRSTDFDRTLDSAQLVLAGLYPPSANANWNPKLLWQPIPVHTVPKPNDHLLLFDNNPDCPRIAEERTRARTIDPLKSFIAKYQPLFDYLSSKTGMNVNVDNAMAVYDDTLNEILRNMSVPAWMKKKWPEFTEESNEVFGMDATTKTLKKLTGGVLVKHMLEKCEQSVKNKSTIKMYQYSAHDSTLGIWLTVLDLFNGFQPPYSSAVMFEMHKIRNSKPDSEANYAIKIVYRNDSRVDPYTLVVPKCTEMCPLTKFKALTRDIIPDNFEEECKSSSAQSVKIGPLVTATSIFIVCLFL